MILSFLTAVRDQKPVDELEQLRTTTGYEWESDSKTHSAVEAMRYALLYGHSAYVLYMMQNYGRQLITADICCPFLLLAVKLNQFSSVQLICDCSAENTKETDEGYVNTKGCKCMERGKTALHAASELGFLDCLRVLLQNGANQLCIDSEGNTPLECVLQAEFCTYDMFRCAVELARHRQQLQWDVVIKLNALHERFHGNGRSGNDGEVCKICSTLPRFQPSDLTHLSTYVIRHSLGIKLSQNIKKLPVPNIIKYSISFKDPNDN